MQVSFFKSTFTTLLSIFIVVNIFLSVIDCSPAPPGIAVAQVHTHTRSTSPRSKFLQDIRPKEGEVEFSHGEKQMMDHIYERRPDTPRRQRVHPSKQEEYDLHRQKEHTFKRISSTGKNSEHLAEGPEKDFINGAAAETHRYSVHHGKEADKLIRPASPVKANGAKH